MILLNSNKFYNNYITSNNKGIQINSTNASIILGGLNNTVIDNFTELYVTIISNTIKNFNFTASRTFGVIFINQSFGNFITNSYFNITIRDICAIFNNSTNFINGSYFNLSSAHNENAAVLFNNSAYRSIVSNSTIQGFSTGYNVGITMVFNNASNDADNNLINATYAGVVFSFNDSSIVLEKNIYQWNNDIAVIINGSRNNVSTTITGEVLNKYGIVFNGPNNIINNSIISNNTIYGILINNSAINTIVANTLLSYNARYAIYSIVRNFYNWLVA